MDNYEYCASFARSLQNGAPLKVLDYGCGTGTTVGLLIRDGHDAYGCETWYEGGDVSDQVPIALKDRVLTMSDGRIPFPDQTFDLVMSNQVIEHVPDIDLVLSEVARVLKPGGTCLALFPHLEVWREGHCEIPFLHRFPKGSGFRIYYAYALRSLGMGNNLFSDPPMEWSRIICNWLDNWCHYRPLSEIRAAFARHLSYPRHIEAEWASMRSSKLAVMPKWLRTIIARKLAGVVLVVEKPRPALQANGRQSSKIDHEMTLL